MKLLGLYSMDMGGGSPAELTLIFRMGRALPFGVSERFHRDMSAVDVAERLHGLARLIELRARVTVLADALRERIANLTEVRGSKPLTLHLHPADILALGAELDRVAPVMASSDGETPKQWPPRFEGVELVQSITELRLL